MRENAAAKGRRYVTEGRLILTDVRPGRVAGTCRGDGTIYGLGFDGAWALHLPRPIHRLRPPRRRPPRDRRRHRGDGPMTPRPRVRTEPVTVCGLCLVRIPGLQPIPPTNP